MFIVENKKKSFTKFVKEFSCLDQVAVIFGNTKKSHYYII